MDAQPRLDLTEMRRPLGAEFIDGVGFDEVKIARDFVSGSAEGPDTALVTAMVGMAHALGAITVAEGVETGAQAESLLTAVAAGCGVADGASLPLPADVLGTIERFLFG